MKFFDRLFGKEAEQYQVLQAEVSVGDAFRTWCQSDVGQYIIGRAEQYETEILRELAGTDPKDHMRIVQLQAESHIHTSLLQWMEEAMEQGEVARFQLSNFDE